MERARELMRVHNFQPQPHVLALMLALADAELERVANYLDGYAGGHYMAQSCATAIRNMKEE